MNAACFVLRRGESSSLSETMLYFGYGLTLPARILISSRNITNLSNKNISGEKQGPI